MSTCTATPTDRAGDWTQTYTGRAFWPLDPRPDEVNIFDIAHALSMLCRYGGHSREFYSVAEHSVLMSRAVAPENALWALLHDAAEAYVIDVPRPLKHQLPDYMAIEDRVHAAILTRFGLPLDEPAEVKAADTRICVDERILLMTAPPHPWRAEENIEALGVNIECWVPKQGEWEFMERFEEITP